MLPADYLVVDFFEVPYARLGELEKAASATKFGLRPDSEPLDSMLKSLTRPAPSLAEVDPYFLPLLALLDDTGVCPSEVPAYTDLLCDLVELHGGAWTIVERSRDLLARLDSELFREDALRAFWNRHFESVPDAAGGMLQALARLRNVIAALRPETFLLIRIPAVDQSGAAVPAID